MLHVRRSLAQTVWGPWRGYCEREDMARQRVRDKVVAQRGYGYDRAVRCGFFLKVRAKAPSKGDEVGMRKHA